MTGVQTCALPICAESLTLNVENGSVTILGAVGDTQRLGGFSIPLASGLGVSIGGSILTDSEAVAGGIVQIAPNLILSANTLIDTQGSGKGGTLSLGAVTMTGSYSLNCEAGIGSISIASLSSPLTNALLTGQNVTVTGVSSIGSLLINNTGILTLGTGAFTLTRTFDQVGTGNCFLNSNLSASEVTFTTDLTISQTPITV